jgi:lambda family phage portal protein
MGTPDPIRGMRAFDAGKAARRLRSIPTAPSSINSQIAQYGSSVLARSRYLTQNNPYAANAKEAFVAALAGDGINPSSRIEDRDLREEVHEAFEDWSDVCDADHLTNFRGLQALIAAELFEAGECFVRIHRRSSTDGMTVPIQLQVIPAEMLPTAKDLTQKSNIEMGIEFGPDGRRIAYHFLDRHPGNASTTGGTPTKVRVLAEDVLHLFRPSVAGQIRGVPQTISAIAKLAMMDCYDDAELERKRVAALFGGFVTRDAPSSDEGSPLEGIMDLADALDSSGAAREGLEPGLFIDLEPGEKVTFSEPADVGGNYEVFQYRTLTAIAAGFGVPYAAMTGDLRSTSYSSIRAGLVEFRRRITAVQKHTMVHQLCKPIWKLWLQEAAIAGFIPISPAQMISEPKVARCDWVPPRWEWVDPLKDLKAEQLAVECGFKSRSDVIISTGSDPVEVDRRIARDREREAELGLDFGPASDFSDPTTDGNSNGQF